MKVSTLGNHPACCLGILLCIAAQGTLAQTGAVEPAEAANTNAHSMIIKVIDAVTARPVPNAVIYRPYRPPFGLLAADSEAPEPTQATDESGMVTLSVPASFVSANHFSLAVSNASYPARYVSWNVQQGAVRGALPLEYTFRLEPGVTIGGVVRDERGQPMSGVTVSPCGNGEGAYNYNTTDTRDREYSSLPRDDQRGVTTDARGFWRYDRFPPDITRLTVDVIRPDGSRESFVTTPPGQRYPTEAGEPVELAALRATNAVLVIKEGVAIRGVVVDESGKAITNAEVRERSGSTWDTPSFQVTNDAQGRFAFPHRSSLQYLVTAEAEGYALSSVIATVAPDMEELKLVLPPAQPLRLRLLGEQDEPVVGATVKLPEYRNRGHLLTWKGTTDAEGRLTWGSAPRRALTVAITPTNHPPRMARLESKLEEQVIRLQREKSNSIHLRLRVVDAGTKLPVSAFAVWRDMQPTMGFKESNWRGTNGSFMADLAKGEFREGWETTYRLQVRAEGYTPWSSETAYLDEGDFEATVTLMKAKAPAGVVLLPDGKPAADAKVMLLSGSESVFMNSPDNHYPRDGTITVKSAEDGSFKFDGAEDEQRVVVIHPGGFASVTVEEVRRSGTIPLHAYAQIDGVHRSGGQPMAKVRISVKSPVSWEGLDSHHLVFSTTTGTDGSFLFTNLPPGGYVLYRTPHSISGMTTTESHRMILDLAAGETKRIEYGFGGRTVVGRVEADGEVDWKHDPHLISVKLPPAPPGPNYYVYADPKDFEKARRAHGKSRAVLDYERQRQQFQLVFDREGNFKADDVPPGNYELNISVTKPLKNTRNRFERSQEVIGSIRRGITIPTGPAGQEFDLGIFEMELKDSPGARTPPLDFTATRLDGKPFNLISLRGRPVVVCFWGQWAPGSAVTLEMLRAAIASMGSEEKPALVTVNLDSEFDGVRDGLKHLSADWIHTRLTGAALFDVTEQWKVDALPAVVLLDGEGRVKSRDIDSKRLASSVKRLMAAKD